MARAPSVGPPAPETHSPPEFIAKKESQLLMPIIFPVVGMVLSIIADKVGLEDMLKNAYMAVFKVAPKDQYVLAMGVCGLFFILAQWKAMKVGEARIKYGVAWPFQMLGRKEKNAIEYNCVHRAHMHDFEVLPAFIFFLFGATQERQFTAAAAGLLFTIARLATSMGYMTGVAKNRNQGSFGYLGYFLLVGTTFLGIFRRMGCTYFG